MDRGSYADAEQALQRIAARERADTAINPVCWSRSMLHGRKTQNVVVLWHGFTNCPDQFVELGRMFFERGYNVYIPLIPRHGLRDRMTDSLEFLTQAELRMAGVEALRIAFGLGERVDTAGLSLGGVIAAWMAQAAQIGTALAISPFFALPWFGRTYNDYLTRLMLWLPNGWMWWDPRLKERCKPDHAYPRFPTHALATLMQVGEGAFRLAEATPPLAQRCVLVLNARDPAINLGVAKQLWAIWARDAQMVETYEFTDLPAIHDIIERTTFTDAPKLVYPTLVSLMLRANGAALPLPRR